MNRRHRLVQQLQPFAIELRRPDHQAGDIAARPRHASGKAGGDRILAAIGHDDRNGIRRRPCRGDRRAAGNDHIRFEIDQLTSKDRQLLRRARAPLDNEVAAFDKTLLAKLDQSHSMDIDTGLQDTQKRDFVGVAFEITAFPLNRAKLMDTPATPLPEPSTNFTTKAAGN